MSLKTTFLMAVVGGLGFAFDWPGPKIWDRMLMAGIILTCVNLLSMTKRD